MKTLVTLFVAAALVCGALVVFGLRPHSLPPELRLDWWGLPALADAETVERLHQGERIQEAYNETMARTAAKRRVAGEVAAGRMSLLKAAACFRDLNARTPGLAEHVCNSAPGIPYEILLCRQVIAITEAVLEEEFPALAQLPQFQG
jgi:hypothetical protein